MELGLFAEELLAGCGIPSSSFCVESLAAITTQPLSERCPSFINVVSDTFGVGAARRGRKVRDENMKHILAKRMNAYELSKSRYL